MYDFSKKYFLNEEVEHENLMEYIKAMIVWDKLEVFPDNKTWKDGVLEELKELLQTSRPAMLINYNSFYIHWMIKLKRRLIKRIIHQHYFENF